MSNRRPKQDIRDEIAEALIVGLLKFAFPPTILDQDAPLHRRFWRWKGVYLGYLVLGLVAFRQPILTGHYLYAGIALVLHVALPVMGLFVYLTGTVPGFDLPLLTDAQGVAGLTSAVLLLWGGTALVRKRNGVTLHKADDEFAVPLASTYQKAEGSSHLPRLDQAISTAIIGETGSGKTAAMQLLANQFPYTHETAVIAHDYGTDFQSYFRAEGFTVIRIAADDADVTWNLFRDATRDRDCREIAGAIFGAPVGNNPFHGPAKHVFTAVLIYLRREAERQHKRDALGHDDIVEFLAQDLETIYDRLTEYDQLRSHASHLDPESGKGARNVFQTLHEYVDSVFVGEFAHHGEFSIREYIENPDGRVLVIDSAPGEMETLGPMFRLLIDWSIRYAMDAETPVNFILDEIDQLPPLTQLSNLTARGRSVGARALIGVQTVGQLKQTYDGSVAGILGNCPQGLFFSPGDDETARYILSELGEQRTTVESETVRNSGGAFDASEISTSVSLREQERAPIPSGELKQFGPGECVIKARQDWWIGHTTLLDDVRDQL